MTTRRFFVILLFFLATLCFLLAVIFKTLPVDAIALGLALGFGGLTLEHIP